MMDLLLEDEEEALLTNRHSILGPLDFGITFIAELTLLRHLSFINYLFQRISLLPVPFFFHGFLFFVTLFSFFQIVKIIFLLLFITLD